MFNWLREWYELKADIAERRIKPCLSCDVLKMEVERLRMENTRLLDKILLPPPVEPVRTFEESKAVLPKHVPWNVRRQMLEEEDKVKARILSQAPKPEPTEELEKELGVDLSHKNREAQK